MEPAFLGRQRIDDDARRLAVGRAPLGRWLGVGTHRFTRMKRDRERRFRCRRRLRNRNRPDDLTPRHDVGRLKLRGDGLRLPLRHVEEAWKDLVPVLRSDVLRQLDDRGEAEPTVPERLDDFRELLEKLGGGLAVVGGAGRQAEIAGQEREER
jgi:hypothetical protein